MPDWDHHEYVEYVGTRMSSLRRLGYHLCGTTSGADDLVQETITNLYVGWRRIRTVENLDGYVRSMLLRTFLAERRRPWARVGRLDYAPEDVAGPEPDADLRLIMRAALAQVPRRQRAVLVLRFLHDLSVEEVARLLDCSTGTVTMQLSFRALVCRSLPVYAVPLGTNEGLVKPPSLLLCPHDGSAGIVVN